MRMLWQIAGHNNDGGGDDDIDYDVDNDSVGLETSLGAVKDKRSLVGNRNVLTVGRQDIGLQNVPTRKRKDDQKKLVLQQMQALRNPNPSAVAAANQVTRKRIAGRNTRTKPHLGVQRKPWEHSWMKTYLCAKLRMTRCPTSCRT